MSTSDAGRKLRTPRSRIRPPLTTSMTVPSMVPPSCSTFSIFFQACSKRARFLERMRRPSGVFLLHNKCVDLVADAHFVFGTDRLANGKLAHRNDSLGLITDIYQDLVLVYPDNFAGDVYLPLGKC